MRISPKIFILFLFWIAVSTSSPLLAKTPKFESFGDQQFYVLQKSVESRFSIEELAQIQSQVLDVPKVTQSADDELKLYVASVWIKQRYLIEANELLLSVGHKTQFEDLLQYYQALVMLEIGQSQQALPLVAALLQKYPNDADMMFLKSHVLAMNQNYMAAIEALNTNLSLRQKKGKTYLQRGLLDIVIFDYNTAVKDLREALRNLDAKETYYRQMAHFQLGLIYLKYFNKKDKASREFLLGKKLDPTSLLARQLEQNLQ